MIKKYLNVVKLVLKAGFNQARIYMLWF